MRAAFRRTLSTFRRVNRWGENSSQKFLANFNFSELRELACGKEPLLEFLTQERGAGIWSRTLSAATSNINELSTVIVSVHQSLSGLGKAPMPNKPLTPAVPIRRSVQPGYVICLECGFRSRTLRRHLRVAHGLEPAAYYARWKLPAT
jgi:hypothetical protein